MDQNEEKVGDVAVESATPTKKGKTGLILKILGVLVVVFLIVYFLFPQTLSSLTGASSSSGDDMSYAQFSDDSFSVSYPDWPVLSTDLSQLPPNTLVAVGSEKCGFILLATEVPEGQEYKDYIEADLSSQVAQFNGQIDRQDVTDVSAIVEGTTNSGVSEMKSHSRSYLTTGGMSYSFAFVSQESDFEDSCRPYVEKTAKTVSVK